MADLSIFWDALKKELGVFAEQNLSDFKKAFIADGNDFLKKSRDRLERWTQLLADQKLTIDDYTSLVAGLKDLAEVKALEKAGLAKARLAKCRGDLVNLVIKVAGRVFLP
jgi:hypothetical protein